MIMALTLSVGFVVDDAAIVMLENIIRHIRQREALTKQHSRGSSGDRLAILIR